MCYTYLSPSVIALTRHQLQMEDDAFRYSPSSLPFMWSKASSLGSDPEVAIILVILSTSNPPNKHVQANFPSSSNQQVTILKTQHLKFKHTSTDPSLTPLKLYSENTENIFEYQLHARLWVNREGNILTLKFAHSVVERTLAN